MTISDALQKHAIDPKAHLARASDLFNAGGLDNLLYAALEIRLGTEARQAQYARSWDHIPKRFKDSYRTTEVGRALEEAFQVGDKVVRMTHVVDDEGTSVSFTYTPVSRELRRVCEQFGNYLHHRGWHRAYEEDAEGWVEALRRLVVTGLIHLKVATSGELLGPALTEPCDGPVRFTIKMELEGQRAQDVYAVMNNGRVHKVGVQMEDITVVAEFVRARVSVDSFPVALGGDAKYERITSLRGTDIEEAITACDSISLKLDPPSAALPA
ncbi:hypothetical protein [Dyella terrae]|uniref:hypothetical protein n=1 Tax=Dyella terrae TaxID=522259 RepID=UPI001EFE1477|nr:hypothetical protein [Dyella terrae]ULU26981.1 hypothetical protein DYST_03932 [Dyella terrae]